MIEVRLDTLEDEGYFLLPWREDKIGSHGQLLHAGSGSCRVNVYDFTNMSWEKTHWSPGTMIVPATQQDFNQQRTSNVEGPRAHRERSTAEKPVAIVHRICEEMEGATRNEIVAECVAQGVNISTARTQYYKWRKG